MSRNDQKGFGVIEVILIIVAVALIGFIGWYVYDANKKTNESLNNAQKTSEQTANSSNQKQETDKNQGYIVIKDWGVRLKAAQGLKDVRYYAIDKDSFGFTTSELEGYGGNCSHTSPAGSPFVWVGLLARSTQSTMEGMPPAIAKVGNYHYFVRGSGSTCDKAPADLQLSTRPLIITTLNSVEAVQ